MPRKTGLRAAGAPAPKIRKTDARTAELLLDAVSAILTERNNVEVSFSEIAGRSGVNTALINYYFNNKDGLLAALASRDAEGSIASLKRIVESDMSPVEKLTYHINGVMKVYEQRPYLNRLVHHLMERGDPTWSAGLLDSFVKPVLDAQKRILDEGVALGIFKPVDPAFLYYSIVGACDYFNFARPSRRMIFDTELIGPALRTQYSKFVIQMALALLDPTRSE